LFLGRCRNLGRGLRDEAEKPGSENRGYGMFSLPSHRPGTVLREP
jgi:hypothetical protein